MKRSGYIGGLVILLMLLCLACLTSNKRNKATPDPNDPQSTEIQKPITIDTISADTVPFKKRGRSDKTRDAEPENEGRSRGASKRHHLLFNFTAERPGSLRSLSKRSGDSWNSLGGCCSYSITRSDDVARSGKYSTRYELRINDDDVASSKRAEAARATDDESALTERWYGASYYLPRDYIPDVCPELITQWQSLKGVSPPLALWTNNGIWQIVQFGKEHTDLGPYETGKWTDFVFHVKWSTGSDGLIEVWKQGKKVFSVTGANSYPDYNTGNYMKNGIYKWGWKKGYPTNTDKRVLYIDDVKIGDESATYEDVAPGDDD